MTATKTKFRRRQAVRASRWATVVEWVRANHEYLTENRYTAKEAAELARADGVSYATPWRVMRAANQINSRWSRVANAVKNHRTDLSGREWGRIMDVIRDHLGGVTNCRTVAQVAYLLDTFRIRRPLSVIERAMLACGLNVRPLRSERKKKIEA